MAFLSEESLKKINFKYLGRNVKISEKVSIYNPENIEIGDDTRIDDFSILSAGEEGIFIGKNVHISCYCSLIGKKKIELKDFSGISSRTSIYSSTDDFSGEWMTNPTISAKYTNVKSGPVIIGKHVVIGTGSCVLPNVTIDDGSAAGAFSLVTKSFGKSQIIAGIPAKFIKERSKRLFDLEKEWMNDKESKF